MKHRSHLVRELNLFPTTQEPFRLIQETADQIATEQDMPKCECCGAPIYKPGLCNPCQTNHNTQPSLL